MARSGRGLSRPSGSAEQTRLRLAASANTGILCQSRLDHSKALQRGFVFGVISEHRIPLLCSLPVVALAGERDGKTIAAADARPINEQRFGETSGRIGIHSGF